MARSSRRPSTRRMECRRGPRPPARSLARRASRTASRLIGGLRCRLRNRDAHPPAAGVDRRTAATGATTRPRLQRMREPLLLARAGAASRRPLFGYFPGARAAQGRRPAARRRPAVAALVPATRATTSAPRARRCASSSSRCAFRWCALSLTDDELMTERGTARPGRLLRQRAAARRAGRAGRRRRRSASATSAFSATPSRSTLWARTAALALRIPALAQETST